MKLTKQLSAVALALGMAFSGAASATQNVWNSTAPWGSSTLTNYAEWAVFGGTSDASPEVASSGDAASVTETSGASFATSGGNIYSFAAPTSFVATLAGSTSGFFDVYLRIGTLGTLASTSASLNGVGATATVAFNESAGVVMGGESAEQELFWKWSNVAGNSLYTFNFNSTSSSMSLDQLSLATVAVTAVPEPETYAMMGLGLGLMGMIARRRKQDRA